MIYLNRKRKQKVLRCYFCHADGFAVEWRQSVNNKAEIIGIGTFNQQKIKYKYEKKGFGSAMRKRILNLNKEKKNGK